MSNDQKQPIIYLVTSGKTNQHTSPESDDFLAVVKLIEAAVAAQVDLIQIREKTLNARALFELTKRGAELCRESNTRLLVNDRADVAAAAGAHGVHLSTRSLPTEEVRRTCGDGFLIGVSTHSLSEAVSARVNGADFVVFGPIFDTESKREFGEPLGLDRLSEITSALKPFPVFAIGGVTTENTKQCLAAGAAGVAAIRIFNDPAALPNVVSTLRALPS